jgi:hypothetical protein
MSISTFKISNTHMPLVTEADPSAKDVGIILRALSYSLSEVPLQKGQLLTKLIGSVSV